jgi:hypothetical protein
MAREDRAGESLRRRDTPEIRYSAVTAQLP